MRQECTRRARFRQQSPNGGLTRGRPRTTRSVVADAFNPYQPPTSSDLLDSSAAGGEQTNLASRAERFGAATIDGLIQLVIVMPIQFAFHVYDNFPKIELSARNQLAFGAAGFVTFHVVHGYFLVKNSQTVGKKLLRLQIVNFADGVPTPASKILLLRVLPLTLAAQIPGIGAFLSTIDALFIFGRNRRCVHDFIAGTKVIKLGRTPA